MSSGKDPFAWLGLLKWSLSYSDGTSTRTPPAPMSAEKKAFLEKVMREGIVNENERMKTILQDVTDIMTRWKDRAATTSSSIATPDEIDHVLDSLQEVRDICEQIDYARAFCALQGLDFVLGCIQERFVPAPVRGQCGALLATLCQHNPPVQTQLLELGALKILSDAFFINDDVNLRPRIMQAISASVRHHELAESVFCELDQAVPLLLAGLQDAITTTVNRTLLLLRALVTSDTATRPRIERLSPCVSYTCDHLLTSESNEVRETALNMVEQMLEQRVSVITIVQRQDAINHVAVPRKAELRQQLPDDENAAVELQLWEHVLQLLAAAMPDDDVSPTAAAAGAAAAAAPPLLAAPPASANRPQ